MKRLFFEDDSNVFNGDPMIRILKIRKWLFLSGFLIIASKSGWIDFEKLNSMLQFIDVPKERTLWAIYGFGTYILISGCILLAQLIPQYRLNLYSRASLILKTERGEIERQAKDLDEHARLSEHRRISDELKLDAQELWNRSAFYDEAAKVIGKWVRLSEFVLDFIKVMPPFVFLVAAFVIDPFC